MTTKEVPIPTEVGDAKVAEDLIAAHGRGAAVEVQLPEGIDIFTFNSRMRSRLRKSGFVLRYRHSGSARSATYWVESEEQASQRRNARKTA